MITCLLIFDLNTEMTTALLNKLLVRISLYDDAIAYKELFLIYYKRLVVFSTAIVKKKHSAEEIVSDVFLKIWTNRSTLTRIDNFPLYIYVVTKNLSINRLLKEKKAESFSLDELTVEFESLTQAPDQLMITAEMQQQIQNSINALPPKCQMIFKLIKEDGLKYKEVAELLNLSLKTVENQMTIALKKIAHSLNGEFVKTLN